MLLLAVITCYPCRATHPATLRTGVEGVTKAEPKLPSDKNPQFTYGKPGSYRCVWAPQPSFASVERLKNQATEFNVDV